MKKIISFFCLLWFVGGSVLAQSTCDPSLTLTNGSNSVVLSTWQRADGYYFDIEGENLQGITAGCYVYVNGNEQFQLLKATIHTTSTLITVGPIASTTLPKFYTPLYVLMPGEVSYGAVNAAILPYCPDGPLPRPKALTHNLEEDYLCKGSAVTFTATGFEDAPVAWSMSESSNGPWTTMVGTDTILTVSDLTIGTHFFKVTQGEYEATTSLVVGVCCDVIGSQQKVIWEETFDPADDPSPNVSGTKKRYHNQYVGNSYEFASFDNTCGGSEGAGKICDGYYAVVTQSDHANPSMCAWPEGKYDHTSGNGTSGFLIVNAGVADAVIYEQEITPEGGLCTTGMWYNFSLYATNIAPATADPAKFILEIIEIKKDETQEILSQWSTGEIEGSLMENWYRYGTSFSPTSEAEKILVRVWNAGKSNNGNDLVMDDLQVSVCQPSAESFVGDVADKQKVSTNKDCGDIEIVSAVLGGLEEDFYPNGAYYLWLHSLDGGVSFVEVDGKSGVGNATIQYTTQYAASPIQLYAIIATSRESALAIQRNQQLADACATYAITDKVQVSCQGEPTCTNPPTLVFDSIAPICEGTTTKVTLNAVATPSSTLQTITYRGDFVEGNEFDASQASVGSYSVSAYLTDGLCTAMASYTIEIVPNPSVQIQADATELTCEQPITTLTAVSESSVQYTWSNGLTTQAIQVEEGGLYSVQVTDANGCVAKAETNVNDNIEYLEGELWVAPTTVMVGNSVQLAFHATAGKIAQLQWYRNGNAIELNNGTTDTPLLASEYKVVATSACNTVVDSANVTVEWPTVITPYHVDGYNDDFMGSIDEPLPIKIFTRFGNLIYQGEGGWNGYCSDGQMAMPGVYYYTVELPNQEIKTGTIEVYKK